MNKNLKYALLSAMTFIGLLGFTACSSSDEVVDNPDYNPETNSVKSQFSISISEKQIKTRQEAAYTQATGDFANGIKDMRVIPFNAEITGGSTKLANPIVLGDLTAFDYEKSNSKVYANVDVPVGTTNFLFYGKSNVNPSSMADKFRYGMADVEGLGADGGNPSAISFSPVTCYDDENADVGTDLINALNTVAAAKVDDTHPWSTDASLSGVYTAFTSLTVGSSFAVEKVFDLLYQNLKSTYSTSAMSKAIIDAMAGISGVNVPADKAVAGNVTLDESLTGYPGNVGLPDGAARLSFGEGVFSSANKGGYNSTLNVSGFNSYAYPAPLLYFVNTDIKTSNTQQSPYYSTNSWDGILNLYTGGSAVLTSTRSIALKNQIQYMVGRMETTVKADVVATGDDAGKIYDKLGTAITPNFQVTGVIIGGVKPVNWDGTQNTSGSVMTIYDNTMHEVINVTNNTASGVNHTLVFENSANDEKVNIAIEFLNNGADFQGADGVIYNGSKFYLVGTLTLAEGIEGTDPNPGKIFAQDYTTFVNFTIKQGKPEGDDVNGIGVATNGLPDLRTTQKELGLSVDLKWKKGLTFNVVF